MWTDDYEQFKADMLGAFHKAKETLPDELFGHEDAVLILGQKKANPVLAGTTELMVFCCPIDQADAVKELFFDAYIVCGFGGLPEESIKELWNKISIKIN